MTTYRLGKKPPRFDPRTLQFAKYRTQTPVAAPTEVSWVMNVLSWPMLLNDQIGDCTCAAAGHMIQQWTRYANSPGVIPTNQQILAAYEAVSGYIPGNPSTDNGAYMLDVLNYWKKSGIAGHSIAAYVQVNPLNLDEVREAVYLFGNVYIGLQLPASASGESAWTVPDEGLNGDGTPGSWGGHCVPIDAVSPMTLTCITWGERLKMSHNFFQAYCDEAFAVLTQDWIAAASKRSPGGFDFAALQSDLALVTA